MDYSKFELYHHGIKGQKWGVRRYQNKDGTLTPAGKKRAKKELTPEERQRRKETTKKVLIGVAAGLTVGTLVALATKNPAATKAAVSKIGGMTVKALKATKNASAKAGKALVSNAKVGIKEGVKTAAKEAPKKAVLAVGTGVTMNATKRLLDKTVGKAEAERIMKANNKKKIDSFWKVQEEDDD